MAEINTFPPSTKLNPTATTANVNNNQPKSTLKSESQSATVDTSSTSHKKRLVTEKMLRLAM